MSKISLKTETVLVTGAAGLVGRSVLELLAARGNTIVAIDRVATSHAGTEIHECDLKDVHRLHAIAAATKPHSVVHCGAYSGPMVARDNPYDLITVNIMGTANMLELARIGKMRRFVYCSSASVYGSTTVGPVNENVPLNPSTVYGATKLAAEKLVLSYAKEHGVDGAALRLAWIYGSNRTTACTLRQMIADTLEGRSTRLHWGDDFHRQYIHADDAAAAIIAALDASSLQQRVYNVTGGSYYTLGEVAALVRKVLPQADIALEPGPDPLDDIQHEFDLTAVQRELGFTPSITLESGIARMAENLRVDSQPGVSA